ncbi:MAG TPA: type II toxin-antitoxin system mRNA interferase toxin, RelE/StbE family [bacterium]|nr:type II toxin-antitoxin system mRNA interferase toxin, RelE/StbE family [bacterium]HPN42897.1 type II toxin-antitoxin system mRNA interferase toxin, RelE/StbE family [bacterium]
MTRVLLRSSAFIHTARKLINRQPNLAMELQTTLELLSADAFHPHLKTHKLKGDLHDSWACSINYYLRIVFRFVKYNENEAILLESIGSHEEVY